MPEPDVLHAVACSAALVAAGSAAAGGFLARGSTAVPAAAWGVAAALALAVEMGCRAAGGLADPASGAAARLGVAALAACPIMSLLGAKRPQHGVWQWIVATLAVVLAMPAATAVLVRPGTEPDVHLVRRGLLGLVVVVGWLNFVATRHGVAATLVAAGQATLVWPLLAGAGGGWSPALDAAGAGLVAGGAAAAAMQSARAGRRGDGSPATVSEVFDALRETFGAAWTLRVVERFNAVAADRGWTQRLAFRGPVGEAGTAWPREAVRVFHALARRFVSVAWLRRHGWR